MNWFEAVIYGLISGLTEFLPISSFAHQTIFRFFVGMDMANPVQQLLIHIASLAAIFAAYRPSQDLLSQRQSGNRRKRRYQNITALDMRIIKTSFWSYLAIYILFYSLLGITNNLLSISIFLLFNGIILFAPERMLRGNKDAKSMSSVDSILIGSIAALSVFSGISRIGGASSVAISRGADRQNALKWSLLLSVFAISALCVFDLYQIFLFSDAITFYNVFCWFLSAASAYIGGYLGIKLILFIAIKADFSGFAYYSWGASLFAFILYLTVV